MSRILIVFALALAACSAQPTPAPVANRSLPYTLDSSQLRPELRAFIRAYIDESTDPSRSVFLVSGTETDSGTLYRVSELRGSGEGWNPMQFSPLYTTTLRGRRVWFDGGLGRYAQVEDSAFFYAKLPAHWGGVGPDQDFVLFCRGGWAMHLRYDGHRSIRKGVRDHFAPYVAKAQVRFVPPVIDKWVKTAPEDSSLRSE